MAECASLLISSSQSDLRYTNQRNREQLVHDLITPHWPSRHCLVEIIHLLSTQPLPIRRDLLSQAHSEIFHPHLDGAMGLAHERLNLDAAGLHPNVVVTIQSTWAISMQTLYAAKWQVFEAWCDQCTVIPHQCSVSEVLCFLQEILDKGRVFSTIKVYSATITACHVSFSNTSVARHPLICRFRCTSVTPGC